MNKGVPLTITLCCVWPLVVHLAIRYGWPYIANRDWRNIRWDEVKWPWSKHE